VGWFSDALKFESWRGKQFWDAIRDDPQRLFTGAFDPIGTSIYNGITGDNLEPLGNQLGAPTEDQYARAEARGMNTSGARTMNDAAQVIAAIYGGQALAGAAGVGGSGAAGSGAGASSSATNAARMGSALVRTTGQQPGPTYQPPPHAKPTQFNDTFRKSQQDRKRKRLALSLMRAR
jgi:hypothetical protein